MMAFHVYANKKEEWLEEGFQIGEILVYGQSYNFYYHSIIIIKM